MKFLSVIIFTIASFFSFAQGKVSKQTTDSLARQKTEKINRFLDLSSKDVMADIGTGSGYSLIPIANNCPDCRFTVEDIDSTTCNRKALSKKIDKTVNKTSIDNFEFHYGAEKSTNLPSATYNKVLIFDVIHELTYKTEMLADIKRILKPNGSIFIEEILVHNPVKKDKVCNYPFLTEPVFKQLLQDNNLAIAREEITFDTGNNRYIKIFGCTVRP